LANVYTIMLVRMEQIGVYSLLLWGWVLDGNISDRFDLIGGAIAFGRRIGDHVLALLTTAVRATLYLLTAERIRIFAR
jgi:hypothetical protein